MNTDTQKVGRTAARQQAGLEWRSIASWCAVIVLGGGVVIGPILLGSVQAWPRFGLEVAMAMSVVIWALGGRRPIAAAAAALAITALVGMQVMPLPDWLLVRIAPISAGAWKVSRMGLPLAWSTISTDPGATAMAARRLLLGLATVAVVADLSRTASLRRPLVAAIASSALILWGLGIVFPCPGNSSLLLGRVSIAGPFADRGRTPIDPPVATAGFGYPAWTEVGGQRYLADEWVTGDGFGPYVISNHFAGALGLTIPFLVAGWLWITRGRVADMVRFPIAAAVFLAAMWTTWRLAEARAGTLAIGLSATVFFAMVLESSVLRRACQGAALAYAAALFGFLILFYGQFQHADRWFPQVLRPAVAHLLDDKRTVATHAAYRMFRASPLFGTGLGSYGDLHQYLIADGLPHYFTHNDYLQLLAETGLLGGLVAAVIAIGSVVLAWRCQRLATGSDRLVGAASWAAVSAIAVHSAFDWNLHVPANGFLACVVGGLALAGGGQLELPRRLAWVGRICPPVLLACACLIAVAILGRDAASEARQRRLRETLVTERLGAGDPLKSPTDLQWNGVIRAAERMAFWDPSSGQLSALIAQAHLHMSARPLPMDEAERHREEAASWSRRARSKSATCRGVPEPLPNEPRSPRSG